MAKKPKFYHVQKLVGTRGRTASGQVDTRIGGTWVTIGVRKTNRTVAERMAQHAQIDNPNSIIRIEERAEV